MSNLSIMGYSDSFGEIYQRNKRKLVLYGAGNGYSIYKNSLPRPYMICDEKAKILNTIDGLRVCLPEDIQKIGEPVYIVVTVIDSNTFSEICGHLKSLDIEGAIFHAANNIGIKCTSFWGSAPTYKIDESASSRAMKINLVCNDTKWILHKFAARMMEHIDDPKIEVMLSDHSIEDADINHHIQFATYETYNNDTLMISHVDCWQLFDRLREQLAVAKLGICMSKETMDTLVRYGVRRDKLCYINPAHDGIIRPRKKVIGITHQTHEYDVRKRISALFETLEGIDPCFFKFVIMGAGWANVIKRLNEMGFETDYFPDFEMNTYCSLIQSLDYYLFFGFDEGSMGYLDAVAAGIKTIVTPQGFHLDNNFPIDYPCRTVEEFRSAFMSIQDDIERRTRSVSSWTWENYTKKHITIWEYILKRKDLNTLYCDQLKYEDGIFSMYLEDNRIPYSGMETIR